MALPITTGADLKTARERLGLTQACLSAEMGVVIRTYQAWEEDMRSSIPDVASETLDEMQRKASRIVWRMLALISDIIEEKKEKVCSFVLYRYQKDEDLWKYWPEMKGFPALYFSATVDRVSRELRADGIETHIVYINPEKYDAWLGSREDNEKNRFEWARLEYEEKIGSH